MFSGQTRTGVHISERKIQYIELLIENTGVQIVDIGEFNFNENIDFSKIKETIVQEMLVAALDSKLFANRKYSTIVSFALPLNVFNFFTSITALSSILRNISPFIDGKCSYSIRKLISLI